MSFDAFSQAFAGTDWDRLASAPAARAAAASAASARGGDKAAAEPRQAARTGLSGGDAVKAKGTANATATTAAKAKDDEDFLTFDDVLDIVNPLQHIPIVDAVYRRLTGDTIRPQASILGGFLFGGLIGGAAATAGVLFTEATGVDPVADTIAWIAGDDDAPTQVAQGQSTAPQTAATQALPQAAAPQTAARTAPVQTAQALNGSRPIPEGVSAGTNARRALAAANQSALQLLAQDLAAGGHVTEDGGAPQTAQTATAGRAPSPVQTAQTGSPPDDRHMPMRGLVATNTRMPRDVGRQYAAYSRTTPAAAMSPARAVATPLTPAGSAVPPAPPARPAIGGIKPLSLVPQVRPLDVGPDGTPARPADLPAPVTDAQAAPAAGAPATPTPGDTGPDAIQALMMRNLEKYQAMSRGPGRIPTRSQMPAAVNG